MAATTYRALYGLSKACFWLDSQALRICKVVQGTNTGHMSSEIYLEQHHSIMTQFRSMEGYCIATQHRSMKVYCILLPLGGALPIE